MAPKKAKLTHKASSSSRRASYQPFVDDEAKNSYERDLNTWISIREREIELDENLIWGLIEEEVWEELVKQPPATNILVVREFFFNDPTRELQWVMVWGKLVSYDVKAINAYYNFDKEMEPDDYENLLKEWNFDELIKFLPNNTGYGKGIRPVKRNILPHLPSQPQPKYGINSFLLNSSLAQIPQR